MFVCLLMCLYWLLLGGAGASAWCPTLFPPWGLFYFLFTSLVSRGVLHPTIKREIVMIAVGKGKAEYAPGILGWYCDYQYRRFFRPCVTFICRVCHRLCLSLGSLLRLLYFIYSFFPHLVVVCVCCQAGAANTVHAKGEKGLYSPWKQRALRREDFGCRNGAETHRITHKQTNYKYRLSQ
ncbi:T. brucei spp.-specific protein [Trypanosoma brucei gambiense DAL972]|uniref:T. brucei spp.-specific protein n=1 Tax=Trypanosoma brucei gambiense (strain MHOM/CI/86/DAL972) TaxID=679716 RepID=C9ZR82_TRYB9|nr:T. brucei spp.-specific protein [Trypanosoma brucei gambiense DAL972]CBH11912.1 T. brucei spp.-specific protein [Trypanosoma brucei gambiense DAL972]|eukprot:XP_011774197.1 T. brucei spp.-specific protein [Trypanosoma brucei gambiense DAL972]